MSTTTNYRYKRITMPSPKLHVWGDGETASFYDNACTVTRCYGKQIVAEIFYDYITGRRGRWTTNKKYACQEHLEKFIKNNPSAIEIK